MKVGLSVKGDDFFRANLRRLSELPTAEIDKVLAESLEPLRAATEANARKLREPGSPKGGHLDEGIVSLRMPKKSSRRRRVWWVTFTRRARKIAHLVEFGTLPHQQPKRGHKHPGARPSPFFRPAFDAHAAEVLAVLSVRLQAALFKGLRLK